MKHHRPLTTLFLESCLAEYQISSPCQTQSTASQHNLSGQGNLLGSSVSEKSRFEATLLGIFMPWVYWFLVAAITSYHKLGDLKQKFILSQLWRPDVHSQGVSRTDSFWRLRGRICSVPLPGSGGGWQTLTFWDLHCTTPISTSILIWPPCVSVFP